MKGVARKSSKQLPGEESAWPPPSAPAAVCCKDHDFCYSQVTFTMLLSDHFQEKKWERSEGRMEEKWERSEGRGK